MLSRRPARRRSFLIESLEHRTLLSSYYFSAAGNDTTGTGTQAAPWATINKLNSLDLNAGDSVFFRGGDIFSGGIYLNPTDAGASASALKSRPAARTRSRARCG